MHWLMCGSGGELARCGWLKDKFGISWRVVPRVLEDMTENGDEEQKRRVAEAKSKMGKFEIEGLRKAFEGPGG